MTPSPASPALDAKGLSKERIEQIKAVAVDFFRWFWNTPGTNADQGFDEWAGGPGQVALSALSARERAEAAATLDIFDGRSTTYLEDGAFKLPDGKHALYAASPPVAVRATADMVKRARECLANAKVTGENPTSQRALEYRLGELLDALDTPASSVVDEGMVRTLREIASQRLSTEMDDEDQERAAFEDGYDIIVTKVRALLAALTPGDRP